MYYRKTFYGYNKEGIDEAKAQIDKRYKEELDEVDREIREALSEQKLLLNQLNGMIIEIKRLRESAWQMKQLREYMPYIVTQKKLVFQKETMEAIHNTEQYVLEINKHVQAIDTEIEKVKLRIRTFMNSVSQLLVLRNVKEYDDILRHFDQVVEKMAPQKSSEAAPGSTEIPKDEMFYAEEIAVQKDMHSAQKTEKEPLFDLVNQQPIVEGIDEDFLVQLEDTQLDSDIDLDQRILYEKEIIMPMAIAREAAAGVQGDNVLNCGNLDLFSFSEEEKTNKTEEVLPKLEDHKKIKRDELTSYDVLIKDDKSPNDNTILFAEHDKEMADLLTHLFEREGYDVIYVPDGRDAYDIISSTQPPQIVLLNMMLPYYDGYQLISHIRSRKDWGFVPIVAITSNQAEWDTVNILNAGANDVIRKPYSPREILARIRRLTVANEKVI